MIHSLIRSSSPRSGGNETPTVTNPFPHANGVQTAPPPPPDSSSKYGGFRFMRGSSIPEQSHLKVIPGRLVSRDLLTLFIINSVFKLTAAAASSQRQGMRNWNSWRCNTVVFLSGPPVNTYTEKKKKKRWRLQPTCRVKTECHWNPNFFFFLSLFHVSVKINHKSSL